MFGYFISIFITNGILNPFVLNILIFSYITSLLDTNFLKKLNLSHLI